MSYRSGRKSNVKAPFSNDTTVAGLKMFGLVPRANTVGPGN